MRSVFELIGGTEVVVAAIDEFYERVLDDHELAPSFAGVDLDRLKAHQRTFLTVALGGPREYEGRPLAEAHDGLGVTARQYALTVGHLVATFSDMGVELELICEIGARLAALEPEVVEPEQAAL